MTTSTSREPLAVRSELYVRVLGWWMCVIAVFGLIVATVSSGPAAAIPVCIFWAAPGLWWGWRVSHLGVFEEPDVLIVRNPFRTYRLPWSEIADITTKRRHTSHRLIAPLVALFNRTVGVIEVASRAKLIEMQTTESLWPVTRMLSRSPDQAAANVEMVRAAWLARRDTSPDGADLLRTTDRVHQPLPQRRALSVMNRRSAALVGRDSGMVRPDVRGHLRPPVRSGRPRWNTGQVSGDDAAGYWLSGPDNDSFIYRGADVPACPDCLLVTDHEWVNPEFVPKRKELDYSSTFDGVTIVSRRFAEFASGEPGVRFLTLPAASDFAVLHIDAIVRVDTDRRGTRFVDQCPGCGRFRQIAGATPVFVREGCEVPAGFSRSDQRYGSAADEGQHRPVAQPAVVMVDLELGQRLDGEQFRGPGIHAITR